MDRPLFFSFLERGGGYFCSSEVPVDYCNSDQVSDGSLDNSGLEEGLATPRSSLPHFPRSS